MWVSWCVAALAADPIWPGGHFVDEAFVALVEQGQSEQWHPNRLISELHLEAGTARDTTDAPHTCRYVVEDDGATISLSDCGGGGIDRQGTIDGDRITLPAAWGDEITLVRTDWTVAEHLASAREARTLALLPRVEGGWRVDPSPHVLELSPERADDFSLETCVDGGTQTVCLRTGGQGYALRGDQLQPGEVWPGHDVGELAQFRAVPGPRLLRDRPCERRICGLVWRGDQTLRFAPAGDREHDVLLDAPLLGGTLTIESSTDRRIRARIRAHTRAAVEVHGGLVGLGDLGAVTPWRRAKIVRGTIQIPGDLRPAQIGLAPEQLIEALEHQLPPSRADDTFRAHAVDALHSCPGLDRSPCSSGIGALEIELVAGGREPERIVLVLESRFGARADPPVPIPPP